MCLQRRLEEAQAFMETVNNSKLGQDWREKTAASEPGQLGRFVGEGMMIGLLLHPPPPLVAKDLPPIPLPTQDYGPAGMQK